jgi:parallel beta-helix repeat protein
MSFAAFVERSSYNAQGTDVSGLISADTTWDLPGSPYIVIDNVTVDSGVSLTIDAGVEVKFDGPFSLFVNGTLRAIGNATNRINFTSNNPFPGPNDWNGIEISPGGNATIAFSDIFYARDGLYLNSSSGNNVSNNRFMHNFGLGIRLVDSHSNSVRNNNVSHNNGDGLNLDSSNDNSIRNNTFVENGPYGIYMINSSNNTLAGNGMHNCFNGMGLWSGSFNNTLINNTLSSNSMSGINVESSLSNTISGNIVVGNENGIYLWSSSMNNEISNNTILSNSNTGINVWFNSNYNTMTYNLLSGNGNGTYFSSAHRNTLYRNIISNSYVYGARLVQSSNNTIYHNNFADNFQQAFDNSNNFWNVSYYWDAPHPSGGNYWSDYDAFFEGCIDDNDSALTPQTGPGGPDGICDFQYTIDADSQDFYPLTAPVDFARPMIVSTTPADGASGVSLSQDVIITFNEPMYQTSFSFVIAPDPGGWIWTWNATGDTATGQHNDFLESTTYTFTVTFAEDLAGNVLTSGPVPNPWNWTTTIDGIPPTITATTPVDDESGVPIDQDVVIIFSEPMDTATFTYTIVPDPGGWTWTWSMGDTVVTGSHLDFDMGTDYAFNVTKVYDVIGNPLAPGPVPNPWNWTTMTDNIPPTIMSTVPVDDASGVPVDRDVVITFSESIDTATFAYTVVPDPGGWTWTWSMGDTVATGSHDDFDVNGDYTFTVTDANDLNGNTLISGPVPNPWNWTTVFVDVQAPTVEAWEPGGSQGQSFTQGELVDVFWYAYDIVGLAPNPIDIFYGDGSSSWNPVALGESNDGMHVWDTSGVSCPGTYWINVSATDTSGWTAHDAGNYSFDLMCPVTLPPEIISVGTEPMAQFTGRNITISAEVYDGDTAVENLTVFVNIARLDEVSTGNYSAECDSGGNCILQVSFDLQGTYFFTVWVNDTDDNWDYATHLFVIVEDPSERGQRDQNWKPVIAFIFTFVLLLIGSMLSYWRPLRLKGVLHFDRVYTFILGVLPIAVLEAATGFTSLFTGLLCIPPVYGSGVIVDAFIIIIGLLIDLAIFTKGRSASTYIGETTFDTEKDENED